MKFVTVKPNVLFRPILGETAKDVLLAALAATDQGVMITDLNHQALACNEKFGLLWGVSIEEVVNSEPGKVRHMVEHRLPDIALWSKNLEQVYSDSTRAQDDLQELKNPKIVVRRYTGPVWNEAGEVIGRIWTFLDVTLEEKRRKRSQLLQDTSLISNSTPNIIYENLVQEVANFYDSLALLSISRGNYMDFQAVGAPADHPARSMTGNVLEDSYCKFCVSSGPIIVQNALEKQEALDLTPVKLGYTRYMGTPLFSPNGELYGTLCILDGHSDQILDQEDLALLGLIAMRISSELQRERYIQSLESDLAEAQLIAIQNEKLAVIGTLSASIAHDIRNILAAMKLDLNAGPIAIERHIDRFSLLAHRLISFAKPNNMELEPVDLIQSLNRVIELLSAHARIAKISISTDFKVLSPHVLADPARLDHLFMNLILNAIQAMSKGGSLNVDAFHELDNLIIVISDTGSGILEDQLDKLFLPFASTRNDGFGLGLFSANQIASECKGSIEVQTEVGTGTSFIVRIPRYES